MSYIQDNLMPIEKILFSARVHPAVFVRAAIAFLLSIVVLIFAVNQGLKNDPLAGMFAGFLLLFAFGFLIASILLALEALINIWTTEFAVTNYRIIAKTGLLRRHTLEMLLSKVESISVRQSIIGRIFNFGTVTVTGTGGTEEDFRSISAPFAVRKKINQIIQQATQVDSRYAAPIAV